MCQQNAVKPCSIPARKTNQRSYEIWKHLFNVAEKLFINHNLLQELLYCKVKSISRIVRQFFVGVRWSDVFTIRTLLPLHVCVQWNAVVKNTKDQCYTIGLHTRGGGKQWKIIFLDLANYSVLLSALLLHKLE